MSEEVAQQREKKLVLATARDTISIEAQTLKDLLSVIDENFYLAVRHIAESRGKVVVSGIGKSGIIAQKIAATLSSTGTPAVFLHPADAIHGDLGMVESDDTVLILSRSGETPEIRVLVQVLRTFNNTIIAMVSEKDSFLARNAHIVLWVPVRKEACPNNLAPTASTTAQLALGDALAMALMKLRGFDRHDFAKVHPGGTLGKKLYLRVRDLYQLNARPACLPSTPLKEAIFIITEGRLGAVVVVDQNNRVLGIVTDGDVRRAVQKHTWAQLETLTAGDIMSSPPKTIHPDELAVEALERMRKNKITQLVVVDERGSYLGVVHMHDLVREGLI